MPNKISISNDITIVLMSPNLSPHQYFGPVPPPAGVPALVPLGIAFELPVPMFWPHGYALRQNRLTETVLHKHLPMVQDGHNCGADIIHVQIVPGPSNVMTLIHMAFSSRKTNFSSSKLVVDGRNVAMATMISLPPAPMTSCSDPISAPLSDSPTSHLNSLVVTMQWADIIIGWSAVAASMLIDYVFGVYLPAKKPSETPTQWEFVADALVGKIAPMNGKEAARQGLAITTGFARMATTDGSAEMTVTVGSPYASMTAGVIRGSGGYEGVQRHQVFDTVGESRGAEDGYSGSVEVRNPTGLTRIQHGDDEHVEMSTNPRHWGQL